MEKSRKLGKAGERTTDDRLSHLPEPIIYHILSFLDTKAAVQTSVLSRAWRCAWKHVPDLHLNTASFQRYSRFVRFGDKVLSRRYPLNLRKVCFIDDEVMNRRQRDGRLCERVIKYAFSHDAQHFMIDLDHEFDFEDNCEFSRLFGSVMNSNVETLELTWVKLDYKSQYSGFGSLTTLNLYYCWLNVLDFLSDSNFPCMKNLVIEKCECRSDNDVGSISGLNLVSLKLLPVPFDQFDISAPKLRFLSFRDWRLSPQLSMLSLPSLEHVEIRVSGYFEYDQQLLSLFQDLHNARYLMLIDVCIALCAFNV